MIEQKTTLRILKASISLALTIQVRDLTLHSSETGAARSQMFWAGRQECRHYRSAEEVLRVNPCVEKIHNTNKRLRKVCYPYTKIEKQRTKSSVVDMLPSGTL